MRRRLRDAAVGASCGLVWGLLLFFLGLGPARADDHRLRLQASEVPVILVEHHGFPLVSLNAWFRVGPALDPPGKGGLTALTLRMLLRGTRVRDRAALEEAFEALGTEVYTSPLGHAAGIGGSVLRRNLGTFTDLLAEVLTQPAFPEEDLEKVKREMLAEIEAMTDDDGRLAGRWFRRLLFKAHPMGQLASGTRASVRSLTREDVIAHHQRYFGRNNLLIGASGDLTSDQLTALLDAKLADLHPGEASDWTMPAPTAQQGRHVALIDKAERSQTRIYIGHPAIAAGDPDYYALHLASTAFGGTFTSRLMQEVREKRGWSYGAYARLSVEVSGGWYGLTAAPAMKYAEQTLQLMLDEFAKFVDEGLTDDEIEFARGYLESAFAFGVETPALRASQLVHAQLLGRPADYVDGYIERIKALTPDQVRDAVRRRLSPRDLLVVMVCTAPDIRDRVAALPGVDTVSVHPYSAETE